MIILYGWTSSKNGSYLNVTISEFKKHFQKVFVLGRLRKSISIIHSQSKRS